MNFSDQLKGSNIDHTEEDSSKAHSHFQSYSHVIANQLGEDFNFEEGKMMEDSLNPQGRKQRKKSSSAWKYLQLGELRKSTRLNSRDKEDSHARAQDKQVEENKMSEQENEQLQENLRQYNKARVQFEKLLMMPSRNVMIRRLSKKLVEEIPFLYQYPLLNIVDESSKCMLMPEIELICWFQLLKTKFLARNQAEADPTLNQVYQTLYEAARQVKMEHDSRLTVPIEAYLKYYHNMNFDKDRQPSELDGRHQSRGSIQPNSLKEKNVLFKELSKPLQKERFSAIIEYNWVVDAILKNSMPYETQRSNRHQLMTNRKRKRIEKMRPGEYDRSKKGKKKGKGKGGKNKKRKESEEPTEGFELTIESQKSGFNSHRETFKPYQFETTQNQQELHQDLVNQSQEEEDEEYLQQMGNHKRHSITQESQSSSRKTTGNSKGGNLKENPQEFDSNRHYNQGDYTNISPTIQQDLGAASFFEHQGKLFNASSRNSLLENNSHPKFHMNDFFKLNHSLTQLQHEQLQMGAERFGENPGLNLSRTPSISLFLKSLTNNPSSMNNVNSNIDPFNFNSFQ